MDPALAKPQGLELGFGRPIHPSSLALSLAAFQAGRLRLYQIVDVLQADFGKRQKVLARHECPQLCVFSV
jgi:hypothetical protein